MKYDFVIGPFDWSLVRNMDGEECLSANMVEMYGANLFFKAVCCCINQRMFCCIGMWTAIVPIIWVNDDISNSNSECNNHNNNHNNDKRGGKIFHAFLILSVFVEKWRFAIEKNYRNILACKSIDCSHLITWQCWCACLCCCFVYFLSSIAESGLFPFETLTVQP